MEEWGRCGGGEEEVRGRCSEGEEVPHQLSNPLSNFIPVIRTMICVLKILRTSWRFHFKTIA